MESQPSQVELLILAEFDLEELDLLIGEQETIYCNLVECLDPGKAYSHIDELSPNEELIVILHNKRNLLAHRIHSLIQNN